jgi:F-type H+-transporting ATPase subunit epsilon
MLSVQKDLVTLVATTFEWAEDIDSARAQASYERAQKVLHNKDASQVELKLAEARLKRALVRQGVASGR